MAEDVVMCAYEGNVACFALLHGNVCTFSKFILQWNLTALTDLLWLPNF